MVKKKIPAQRRGDALTKDRIVEAAIALLDASGEAGLTFRALAKSLSTGAGAIYWHIDDKDELLTAACDVVVARTLEKLPTSKSPEKAIQNLALALFDAMDAHPWVGAALMQAPREMPLVRILEGLGQQVRSLGVPARMQWSSVGALLNYILGVGGWNAANGQLAKARNLKRADFLESVATAWSQLDPDGFPFTRSLTATVRLHDDRADYLAGIDFILAGIRGSGRLKSP